MSQHVKSKAQRPASAAAGRKLGPGIHLAPFLAPSGGIMLISVASCGVLDTLAEVTGVEGTTLLSGDEQACDAEENLLPHALEWSTGTQQVWPEATTEWLDSKPRRFLPPGVHEAPWPDRDPGRLFLAIDRNHCLVATMRAGVSREEPGVRRDLQAVLDARSKREERRHARQVKHMQAARAAAVQAAPRAEVARA